MPDRGETPVSIIFTGERWSIQRFVSGFANNAFLITCIRTGKSVIVDTPANPDELIAAARATSVGAVLITHGHQDHLEGFAAVIGEFNVPVGIGADDRGSLPGPVQKLPELLDIATGNLIGAGDITLRPVATPGHTPGSTCFVLGGGREAEGVAGPGLPRTSGYPKEAAPRYLSSRLWGTVQRLLFRYFSTSYSLCTSLRGVLLRRIPEVRIYGSFCTESERTTDTFRTTTTRLIEVSAESGPVRPKNSSDALFKAD